MQLLTSLAEQQLGWTLGATELNPQRGLQAQQLTPGEQQTPALQVAEATQLQPVAPLEELKLGPARKWQLPAPLAMELSPQPQALQ